jgi:formylglycine-generating enzyme required for sulfatase activity
MTVAEYACFVRGAGYQELMSSWNKLTWKEQQQRNDHPVVNISWRDALAYAQWLAKLTNVGYRLPTEAEWEKAARGTDGRIYPWGNNWERTRANTGDGDPKMTTPVGSYPQGVSPYGCLDMAGNVWEWTSTVYKNYPYIYNDRMNDLKSINSRVLRGGSWLNDPLGARVAYRVYGDPLESFVGRGVRLACVSAG